MTRLQRISKKFKCRVQAEFKLEYCTTAYLTLSIETTEKSRNTQLLIHHRIVFFTFNEIIFRCFMFQGPKYLVVNQHIISYSKKKHHVGLLDFGHIQPFYNVLKANLNSLIIYWLLGNLQNLFFWVSIHIPIMFLIRTFYIQATTHLLKGLENGEYKNFLQHVKNAYLKK